MDCKRYTDLIFQKIDKKISTEDDMELLHHLETCEDCKCALRELERLEEILQNQPEADVPPGFSDALIDKIKAGSYGGTKRGFRYRPYFSLAAACIVLVVLLCNNIFGWQFFSGNDTNLTDSAGDDVAYTAKEMENTDQADIGGQATERSAGSEEPEILMHNIAEESDVMQRHFGGTAKSAPLDDEKEGVVNFESSDTSEPYMSQDSIVVFEGYGANGESPSSAMSFTAPPPDSAQNSQYYGVASFGIASDDLDSALWGLSYTIKEDLVLEMEIGQFEIFKARVEKLGPEIKIEMQNNDSMIVLLIITAN